MYAREKLSVTYNPVSTFSTIMYDTNVLIVQESVKKT